LDKGTPQELDGSDESYYKLKQSIASLRASTASTAASIAANPSLEFRMIGQVAKALVEVLILTENVLDWSRLAVQKRDDDIEVT
jgi:hypothetical protein